MSNPFDNQQQLITNTYDVLKRTSDSIQRSNIIAYESEQVGTEVLSELGEQRESLLRSTRRLQHADSDLSQSRKIIRKLNREFLYNKIILSSIIFFELVILIGLIVIKFIKF
uniref:t-SNARE coiled-coil homology domain-containing protein n=1 Tax=Glossina pallidipes TaxID=7398 RepID=A0A1A9ZSV3_GLOPL